MAHPTKSGQREFHSKVIEICKLFGRGLIGNTQKTHQMFSVHTTSGEFINGVSLWKRIKYSPSTLSMEKFKNGVFSLWKRIKWFPSTLRRKNLKKKKITGHVGFVFEENSVREITIVNANPAFLNSSSLKKVFVKLFFSDWLLWAVGLIKLRLQFLSLGSLLDKPLLVTGVRL